MAKQTRRRFLRTAAAAGGLGFLGAAGARAGVAEASPGAREVQAAPRAQRILILGGTGFIGPWQVRYAVARGHQVTVFNRGRRQADLPDAVEHLQGDRNTGDLESLKGRTWDVVIDNPTTLPFWARDAASLLQDATPHYVFISTISVYGDLARPGLDEDYPLAGYRGADPFAETMQTLMADAEGLYGPLKAISEREVDRWFAGRNAVVRPGLIVGPGDESDRFTYWPVRVERGGDVLAPVGPDVPVQFIDARDLAEWVVRLAEERTSGVFNATGPRATLSLAGMLHGMRAVTSGDNVVRFVWVPADFLAEHEVQPWMELPVWFGDGAETAGAAGVSIERALAQGLSFRPLAVTAQDTLAWWHALPEERRAAPRAGLAAEKEARVLEAWRRAQPG